MRFLVQNSNCLFFAPNILSGGQHKRVSERENDREREREREQISKKKKFKRIQVHAIGALFQNKAL